MQISVEEALEEMIPTWVSHKVSNAPPVWLVSITPDVHVSVMFGLVNGNYLQSDSAPPIRNVDKIQKDTHVAHRELSDISIVIVNDTCTWSVDTHVGNGDSKEETESKGQLQ